MRYALSAGHVLSYLVQCEQSNTLTLALSLTLVSHPPALDLTLTLALSHTRLALTIAIALSRLHCVSKKHHTHRNTKSQMYSVTII